MTFIVPLPGKFNAPNVLNTILVATVSITEEIGDREAVYVGEISSTTVRRFPAFIATNVIGGAWNLIGTPVAGDVMQFSPAMVVQTIEAARLALQKK